VEQEKPGSPSGNLSRWKGVAAMAKHVFNEIKSFYPVALVYFGWLAGLHNWPIS
jgi:hypothetical protein